MLAIFGYALVAFVLYCLWGFAGMGREVDGK